YDGGTWQPANYRDMYFGQVTARRALELSLNAATSRIANRVGLDAVLTLAQRIGIDSPLPPFPSVVLGAAEVTPLEVAQAYAVIANQGLKASVRGASKVVDRQGQIVERRPLAVERTVSAGAAYMVTHLMEGVLDRGTGRGVREHGFNRPAAGKTGTTNDARDAWFGGFTPNLLAVVWVGFDDKTPLRLTGAGGPRGGGARGACRAFFPARAPRRRPPALFSAAAWCCLGAHRPLGGCSPPPSPPGDHLGGFGGGRAPPFFPPRPPPPPPRR